MSESVQLSIVASVLGWALLTTVRHFMRKRQTCGARTASYQGVGCGGCGGSAPNLPGPKQSYRSAPLIQLGRPKN